MKLNKEWHLKHPMPKSPAPDQRIAWHVAHKKNCSCRDIPEKLKKEITNRKNRKENFNNAR